MSVIEVERLLAPDGPVAERMPGYEYRDGQHRFATSVARTLQGDGVLLFEAPTGTGKTLAYLLPAALHHGRVVISTATRALQDQIMQRDVPTLERYLDAPVPVVALKGLANYVCKRRYHEHLDALAVSSGSSGSPGRGRGLPLVQGWVQTTEWGDRAELATVAETDPLWSHITSSDETRIGPKCAYYDQCFATLARKRAEDAQIVVVNHHLLFAHLAATGGSSRGVLPAFDALIIDEAHQMEDVVTQFFGVQVSTQRVDALTRDATRALVPKGKRPDGAADALRVVENVSRASAALFGALLSDPSGSRGKRPRPAANPPKGRIPVTPERLRGDLEEPLGAVHVALDALHAHAKRRAHEGDAVMQLSRRAKTVRDELARIGEARAGRDIAWFEQRGRGVTLGMSPIDVSEILQNHVYHATPAVVLTSATLATGAADGDDPFRFIKQRLGLDFGIDEGIAQTGFHYPTQCALHVAADLPDPRERGYLPAATDRIARLIRITKGGAFVLCTSFRVMNQLAQAFEGHLAGLQLVQGEAPKAELLERFRADGNAVLFATASFWEGVDVPGEALRLVCLDKLPFDVPDDPLIVARCQRMEEEGQNPFMEYLVPQAALALKQGFGRLIRTRTDRGIVAILDPRLRTKPYGKRIERALPAATPCNTLEEVRAFWNLVPPSP